MRKILSEIRRLKRGPIRRLIDSRLSEFRSMQNRTNKTIFSELCFCLHTANTSAELGIRIQKEMRDDFCSLSEDRLAGRLKELRYRFPNVRAKYIAEAQRYKDDLRNIIRSFKDECEMRDWFVRNIKGLGMKEASHFLRNIGFSNLAIIDFHIVNILVDNRLIEKPKTMTPKKYIAIESVLSKIGEKTNLSLAELDLYLWYLKTGKVLK